MAVALKSEADIEHCRKKLRRSRKFVLKHTAVSEEPVNDLINKPP